MPALPRQPSSRARRAGPRGVDASCQRGGIGGQPARTPKARPACCPTKGAGGLGGASAAAGGGAWAARRPRVKLGSRLGSAGRNGASHGLLPRSAPAAADRDGGPLELDPLLGGGGPFCAWNNSPGLGPTWGPALSIWLLAWLLDLVGGTSLKIAQVLGRLQSPRHPQVILSPFF